VQFAWPHHYASPRFGWRVTRAIGWRINVGAWPVGLARAAARGVR